MEALPVPQRARSLFEQVELLVNVEERLVEALAKDETLDSLRELWHLAQLEQELFRLVQ